MNSDENNAELKTEEGDVSTKETYAKGDEPFPEIPSITDKFVAPKPRGRKPKRGKRGRPSLRGGRVNVEQNKDIHREPVNVKKEPSNLPEESECTPETECSEDFKQTTNDDQSKVLQAMSQQFNSDSKEDTRITSTSKRGKWKKGKRSREAIENTESIEENLKRIKKEEIDDDPSEEVDIGDLEDSVMVKGKSKRGRGRSLSLERASPLFGRSRTPRESVSPAPSKDAMSESSNDSSKSRTRQQFREDDEDMKVKGVLRSKHRTRVASGSPLSVGSTSTKSDGSSKQLTIPETISSKARKDAADQQSAYAQKVKKKKKHFKGLRYSFGTKKKKPKPKAVSIDSPLETASLVSEEIDADSLDSSSIETSSLPNPVADPYDPTEEFDDSQTAISEPVPLQHHRKMQDDEENEETWEDQTQESETQNETMDVDEQENAYEETFDASEEAYQEIPESTEYIPPDDAYDEEGQEAADYGEEEYNYEDLGEEYQIADQEGVEEEEVVLDGEEYQFEGVDEEVADEQQIVDEHHEEEDLEDNQDVDEVADEQEEVADEQEDVADEQEDVADEQEDVADEQEDEVADAQEVEEDVYDEEHQAEEGSEDLEQQTMQLDQEDYAALHENDDVTYYDDEVATEEGVVDDEMQVSYEGEEYIGPTEQVYDEDDPQYEPEQETHSEEDFTVANEVNGIEEHESSGEQLEVEGEPYIAPEDVSVDDQTVENGYDISKEDSDVDMADHEAEDLENLDPMASLPEEDSNDTSDASVQMKEELSALGAVQGSTRRVSKRRTKVNERFVDSEEKDTSRRSKRISHTMVASSGLTLAPRSDGKGYSKMVEEIDQDVADENLHDVLCKCRVMKNPKAVNVGGDVYCQAMDCLDGRIIGCSNIATTHTFLRVSNKIPFTLLCNVHRHRLRRHNCCPGCGLFCTQGIYFECRWDKLGPRHYFHKLCGLNVGGLTLCPHCGTDEAPVEVNLELKLSRKPVVYLKQHQEKKGCMSSARMGCSKSDGTNAAPTDGQLAVANGETHIATQDGRIIHATKMPVGVDKDRLITAINNIKSGKTFNVKLSAKAIYWSCKYNDLEKLIFVLVNGLNPNVKVKEYGNQTGLHTASIHSSLAAMHILVLAGSSLDLTDSQLLTPLMVAIIKGNNDIVNYLVQAGASLQAKTQDGMTCLHLAAKSGNFWSCKHILDSGRLSRHTINIQDEGGWTPLVWASENRCIDIVKILLDCGADPQICDVEQNTALHWAAFSGSTHICSMVLERGCSLRSMNAIGDTPLHIAARQNHVEAVVQLLARGASLDIKNTRGQTPVDCCAPDSQCFLHMTLSKKLTDVMVENGVKTERILSSDIACGKEAVPISCVNGADDEGLPKNYVYISENCEALNVNIDRTISSLKYCECIDGCNSDSCVCSQLNFQCWYDPEGHLLPNFNYHDPPMIFECNRACGCNKLSCHNRVVQHGMTSHLQLFKTEDKGWGVRALKDIPKGSYVCEYVGEIITDLEADQREDDSYLFDLDNRDSETFCIDARQFANVARFINHLCEPNLTPVKVFVDHQDLIFPRIAFFANRQIDADEELGFDYGEKFWVIKYKQFTCGCGLDNCKYSSQTIHQTLENYNKKLQLQNLQESNSKVLES